tara:strand:+ start:4262 stop:5260 length:999 start_codon:yes stop_codon:yes gene_type:complete
MDNQYDQIANNHLRRQGIMDGIIRPDRPTGAKELGDLLTQEQDQRYADNEKSKRVIIGQNQLVAAKVSTIKSLQMGMRELKQEAEIAEMLRQSEIAMSDRQQKEKDDEIYRLNKVIKEADDEEEETPLVLLDMMDRTATAEDALAAIRVELEAVQDFWKSKVADAKKVFEAERDECLSVSGVGNIMEELGTSFALPELKEWVNEVIEDVKDDAESDGIDQGRTEVEDECEQEIDAAVDSGREIENEEVNAKWNDWLNEEFGDELYPLEGGPEPEEFVKKVKATAKSEKKFEALEKFIENTTGWGDFVADISDYWKDQLVSAGYPAEDFGEFA